MPTSTPKLITPIAEKILELKPSRVLDIGVGFGKWGSIVREYADIWWWRFYAHEWKVWLEGIECHKKYESPNWRMYDRIHIGMAEDIVPGLSHFDVVLFIDVIEHIFKPQALELLAEIKKHTKVLIVSYCNLEQKDVRDNKHEDHISKWSQDDFSNFGRVDVLAELEEGQLLMITF